MTQYYGITQVNFTLVDGVLTYRMVKVKKQVMVYKSCHKNTFTKVNL